MTASLYVKRGSTPDTTPPTPHALFDAGIWPKSRVSDKITDIRPGSWHVAVLHGQELFFRLAAETVFQHLDIAHQRGLAIVTDVVETIRTGRCGRIGIIS